MSSNASETGAGKAGATPATPATPAAATKPVKKEYRNPALEALGIKRLRLPSRNWMIFWALVGTLGGGVAYDKYRQHEIRKKWMAKTEIFSESKMDVRERPRKIRVYVVPPPSDYLQEGLKYFRKFIKPILNSSAIDFEIYTEERQGDIRYHVAEEIRKLRRAKLGIDEESKEPETKQETKQMGISTSPLSTFKPTEKLDEDGHPYKAVADLYNPGTLLGVNFRQGERPKVISEDSEVLDQRDAGGIICVGRGAFKEYMNGLHEGLLGPLTAPPQPSKPASIEEVETTDGAEPIATTDNNTEATTSTSTSTSTSAAPTSIIKDAAEGKEIEEHVQKKERTDDDDEEEKLAPVPRPYILPNEFSEANLAPELDLSREFRDENGVPYFFLQPIMVTRNYNLLGFLNSFERIRRFYTKRYQAEDYSEKTYAVLLKRYRQMVMDDINMCIEEENDWPAKWIKTGKEKQSEWCRDFVGDEKVIQLLSVYDDELLSESEKDISKVETTFWK
ncbi:hypothetical protein B5S32_g4028 [[Candida] boidinii]|nr:hypothetical protein B5S29_g2941 [[Candida] boidinii]OWB79792.1 hypothetical protein B5S32_g4028 [[Candida] boidinii]